MSAGLAAIPKLDGTIGALFIGVVVAAALWGIGTGQCYWYYLAYPKDRLYLKALVATVWLADTVHQALITHTMYFFLIQNYFHPAALDDHVWSLVVQALFEGIISFLVQGFFVFRMWKLSRGNYSLVVIPIVLVFAKFGVTCAYTARGLHIQSITEALHKIHGLSLSINGSAAVTDIMIAATLTYLLYTSKSGFSPSDRMVNRLLVYTINTGVITSLVAIVTLSLAAGLTNSPIYGAFYFLTGRLYANTMMASLNARNSIAKNGPPFELASSTTLSAPRYERNTVVTVIITNGGDGEQ